MREPLPPEHSTMPQANLAGRCRSERRAIACQLGGNREAGREGGLCASALLAGEDDNFHSCLHEIRLSLNHEKTIYKKHESTKQIIKRKPISTKTRKHELVLSIL